MKRCLHVKSVMDSSKHLIQNALIVELSSRRKKRKKSLNKLAKDRPELQDLGHLDHREVDLLDHPNQDHLGPRDQVHPDHPNQAHLEVDRRKEEALLDHPDQDLLGRVKADHQKEDLPALPRADHPDQRKVDLLGHRRADHPDHRNRDHLGQRRVDLRRAGRRKVGHLALSEALQTEEVSD